MIRYLLTLIVAHLAVGHPSPAHRVQHSPVQGCTSAVVSLQGNGQVGVSAVCRGSQSEPRFTLTIETYPLSAGQADEAIRGFGRHPRLVGSGSSPTFGSCRRIGRAVRCEGKADGRVRMLIVLHVKNSQRCHEGYSVTTYKGGRCGRGACPVEGTVHILASGPPKRC